MKIISKYKDYYDYLSGVWGVDPNLILDRDNFVPKLSGDDLRIISFVIGGKLCQIYFDGDDYYFGEDIEQFDNTNSRSKFYSYFKKEGKYRVSIGYKNGRKNSAYIVDGIKEGFEWLNEKFDCPILYKTESWLPREHENSDWKKMPLLSETPIVKFIDATDIYRWISDYLAKQLDKKQDILTKVTNSEKIINKGFDLKKSFRPNMK